MVTPSPTATTLPLDSCPITMGAVSTKSPIRPRVQKCTSDPHIPTDCISSSTSEGEGEGEWVYVRERMRVCVCVREKERGVWFSNLLSLVLERLSAPVVGRKCEKMSIFFSFLSNQLQVSSSSQNHTQIPAFFCHLFSLSFKPLAALARSTKVARTSNFDPPEVDSARHLGKGSPCRRHSARGAGACGADAALVPVVPPQPRHLKV